MNKDVICERCRRKKDCKWEKTNCDKCKKKVNKFYPCSPTGYGIYCYCKECYEIFLDNENREVWKYAVSLIGISELHCIKCTQKLNHKNVSGRDTSEFQTSFKCSKCNFEFTIYHGEYGGY